MGWAFGTRRPADPAFGDVERFAIKRCRYRQVEASERREALSCRFESNSGLVLARARLPAQPGHAARSRAAWDRTEAAEAQEPSRRYRSSDT